MCNILAKEKLVISITSVTPVFFVTLHLCFNITEKGHMMVPD